MLPDFRIRQRDYLLELAQALTQELNLDVLLGRILNISIETMAGHAGVIALRSEAGEWKIRVSHGLPGNFLSYIELYLKNVSVETLDPESQELPAISGLLEELTHRASLGLLTGIGLPLVARGKVVGLIFIFRNYRAIFSGNDRALLSSFANQAAIAVQNAQLYAELRRRNMRLDALLDSAGDGIMILAPDFRIERANPALLRMLGIPNEQVIGKKHDLVIRWGTPPHGLTLEQAEAGGWPLTPHAQLYIEGDLQRENKLRPLPVGITYAPLISEEGILINVIATVRDISRFREAEEVKSTFISVISHELKTPVALIKGYVSTLRREDAIWDREIVKDSLQIIEEEADHLTLLIENLLDASRLQAGGLQIKRSDVQLVSVAKRLAERLQTQTSQHKIVVDFPPDFPVIWGDENRLQQVISNLISNSIKYSSGGEIRIGGQVRPDFIIVCVSDEGPGIASEDIPHIFDRFYRSPDTARQTKGAGLGLYLARSIIEAHSGRMWVDPENGKGARICFSLPRTS
jgi:signal transduction histidine kinase